MARPKEFDPSEALDKALELFWTKGFEAASVQTLCTTMGINRGSLYETFGDKEALFVSCMDRYREKQERELFSKLERYEADPKRQLEAFFKASGEISQQNQLRGRGCFMANSTLGSAAELPPVAERVETYQLYQEDVLYRFLQNAASCGLLRQGVQPREGARFLLAIKQGIHVAARSAAGRETLPDVYQMAVKAVF
ncbi:TetR/AcrR family transcriptional regulator [Paenibacillus guangzhouensis]|uniref:TetR/AcrR family transcriptional regulator n=1 Tax=Paenibacillus guangzhouensis TaxID=1473112 RepID=UPI001266E054|nr:TetR/AcrR family transcriptional regulator [Paenibacillus guangzhouensis]